MADRTVKVSIVLQASGYIAGMESAAQKTRLLGSEAEKLSQKREGFEVLGRAALGIGVAAAAGVAAAVVKFTAFDKAMSQVQAVTQETASNMNLLRDAALEAGGRTVYSAVEAANAIEELGKNGLSTAQILSGGLDAALDIAASGNLDVARAAEIAAITMKQFNLAGRDLPHVADLLAAGAGKAAGDVEDLAQALNQSALVAKQTGLSIEETTGVLAAFADAGLIGSDAGTSLKSALQRLTPQSGEAQRAMDDLGISAYDASGAFIGAANFAGVLQKALKDKTDEERNSALATIFGSDAVRAASVLYEQGADGIQKYVDQTNDAGYAAQVAADRLDNLSGDIEKLSGSIDTTFIKSGSGANEILRDMTQTATFLVDNVGSLPEPLLAVGLAFGVVTAAVALSAGAALTAVPKWAQLKATMSGFGISTASTIRNAAARGAALGGLTLILGYVANEFAKADASADEFLGTLDQTTGALTKYSRELLKKNLAESGAYDAARKAGVSQRELTDAIIEGGDRLKSAQDKISALNTAQNFFNVNGTATAIAAGNASQTIREQVAAIETAQATIRNMDAAGDGATESVEDNTDALAQLSGQARDTGESIDELADRIRGFGSATLDTRDANRQFQAAIDELTASVEQNGTTLDVSSEAGRANEAALDSLAQASLERAAAIATETGNQEAATQAITDGRTALVDALSQFGITGQAAQDYADRLGLIPGNIPTVVDLLGIDAAQKKFNDFIARNQGIRIGVGTYANKPLTSADGNLIQYRAFASGGFASGIYAGRAGGIHKFAEPETGWETYISGKPSARARNIGIWEETGSRLGAWDTNGRAPAVATAPSLSLDGMRLTGQLDLGDGLIGLMDARIVASNRETALTGQMGTSKRRSG